MQKQANCNNYLQSCREAFPEICGKKYGTVFDLAAVEAKVKHLRRRTPLTYQDLQFFESPEHWWFRRFWVFPPESLRTTRAAKSSRKTRVSGLNFTTITKRWAVHASKALSEQVRSAMNIIL